MKGNNSKKQSDTDWERLSTMSDEEINFSDNAELDESFFSNATLRMPEPKKSVSLRIDQDVLEWYKPPECGLINTDECCMKNVHAGKKWQCTEGASKEKKG